MSWFGVGGESSELAETEANQAGAVEILGQASTSSALRDDDKVAELTT